MLRIKQPHVVEKHNSWEAPSLAFKRRVSFAWNQKSNHNTLASCLQASERVSDKLRNYLAWLEIKTSLYLDLRKRTAISGCIARPLIVWKVYLSWIRWSKESNKVIHSLDLDKKTCRISKSKIPPLQEPVSKLKIYHSDSEVTELHIENIKVIKFIV